METQDVGSFVRCVCQPDKHGSSLSLNRTQGELLG